MAAGAPATRTVDVVCEYRSPRQIGKLADQCGGRLRVVDGATAYYRLKGKETEGVGLYKCLRGVLAKAAENPGQ